MNVEGVLARPRREQAHSFPFCRKASDQDQSGGLADDRLNCSDCLMVDDWWDDHQTIDRPLSGRALRSLPRETDRRNDVQSEGS